MSHRVDRRKPTLAGRRGQYGPLTWRALARANDERTSPANEAQGKAHARGWLALKRNVDRPIAAILILNTVAHTGGATISGAAFDSVWGDENIWIFSILFTFVILFGTEIAPKVIGVSYNSVLAPILIKPLQLTITFLKPIIFFTDIFSKLFRGKGGAHGKAEVEAADLITLAQMARSRSLIDNSQEQIIVNATKLQTTTADEVMVPADEMVFFDMRRSTGDNLDLARQNLHTRYPVSETGEVGGIVGYVNFKEIFAIDPQEREETLHHYLRHNIVVGKETRAGDVMRQLIAAKRHMAIVKDGRGGIVGMLTLEDVLETLVGDIEEELDAGPTDFVAAGRGKWTVGGGVSVGSIETSTGFELGADGSIALADLLERELQDDARPGACAIVGKCKLTVQKVRRGRALFTLVEAA